MKPNFHLSRLILAFAILLPRIASAAPGDLDNDGLRDAVETNTGVYVSPSDTGTNPAVADTDGDSLPDGMELNLGTSPVSAASKVKRPNIIYILVDDLGYGEVGCFWQNQRTGTWKFATPGLDAMAAEGAKLTHHYVGAPICASSRAALLLGQTQGHAEIRDTQFDKAIPNNHTLARTLKSAGYRTIHIGKAGIAGAMPRNGSSTVNLAGHPLYRGFDRFFGYLFHDDGWEHYPRNGTATYKAWIYDDFQAVTGAHADLYTCDAWTGFAKKSIIEETTNHPDEPFFIFLSYDTPHFYGQHSPTAEYPAGSGVSGGVQWTGAPSYVNTAINDPARVDNVANRHPSVNPSWYPAAQKHVSMIRRIDSSISDILQTLRDLGIDDDTMVVFTSDNGPAETVVYPPSFESYGPFEGLKGDLWEGGVRVPTIVWWPGKIPATNQLSNIREIARPCGNWDWMATFSEMAKIPVPAFSDGTSMLPTLTNQGVQAEKGHLYFEFSYGGATGNLTEFANHRNDPRGQMQAIRIGDFMGVRTAITNGSEPFRIYNVVSDPKQATDVAATRTDLQEQMRYLAISARRKGAGINRPYDNVPIPDVSPGLTENGLICQTFEGHWPWLPDFKQLSPKSVVAVSNISPAPRTRAEDVGLAFSGLISVPTAGAYTFTVNSNAGTCLWLHESRVIDNDYLHVPVKASGPVYLEAGLHPIRLYYRHQTGDPVLSLSYSGPGIPTQPVPSSALFVAGPPPVLQPDAVVTNRETPVLLDVLANDTSTVPLSVSSSGPTILGAAAVETNQVRFTPDAALLGYAEFPYVATNGFSNPSSLIRATVLFDGETWYPFEEAAGNVVNPVGAVAPVSGTLDGFANPANAWKIGKFGIGLDFDGVDDQVNFPGLVLPTGQMPRTFSFWLRTAARSSPELQTLFSYGSNFSGARYVLRLDNTENVASDQALRLEVNAGQMTGTRPLNDGVWHHVAVVNDDFNASGQANVNETRFYIDGVLDPPSSFSGRVLATGSNNVPSLGGSNHNAGYNFAGSIDDLRIFSRALTGAEVVALSRAASRYLNVPAEFPDYDADGVTDEDEWIAGTDPMNRGSFLRIEEITVNGTNVTLGWTGVPGRDYAVEESFDLAEWHPVPGLGPVRINSPVAPGNPAYSPLLSATAPKAGPGRQFFRLRVSLTPQ